MNNFLLKHIAILKKDKNISERLSVLIIIVLLLLQIIVTFVVCRDNNIENYNNLVSRALSTQIASEESRKDNLSAVAAAIASDGMVLQIAEKQNPTYMELSEPCSNIRKFIAASSAVSNIYIYNDKYGYIYDAYSKLYKINDTPVKDIKLGIDEYFQSGEMFFMHSDGNKYNSQKVSSFEIFCSASNRRDLIIVETKTSSVFNSYKNIQNASRCSLVVTTKNGKVIYGGNMFSSLEDISGTDIFKLALDEERFSTVDYKSEKYMVCHAYSNKTKHRYITLIPKSKIAVGFLYGNNYLALYICIIISILILLGTLSIRRNLYRLLIGQTLGDFGKRKNRQNIAIYTEYGLPSEKGNSNLEDYIRSQFKEVYFAAVLMTIDNYADIDKQYSESDLNLIKYGLNNIFNEIFENYNLKFQLANDAREKIEIIAAAETRNQIENIRDALLECQKSFEEYIGIVSSFYIGTAEHKNNLYKSYCSSQNLSSYSFVYGSGVIADKNDVKKMSDEEFEEAKVLCDKIKTEIVSSSEEYSNDMHRLRECLIKMSPSQCYELLCYLLFNICSAVKNIEKQYAIENVIDIGECFNTMLSAKYSGEVLQIVELLYYDILNVLPERRHSKYEQLIEDCNKIIETSYSDQNLSVEYIADKTGFSRGHLTRVYKQTTGISLSSKISDYRLDMAARLLSQTNKKVADIVNEVGFVNSSHFTVTFKQRFGQSPLNYRKQHHNE